MRIVDDPALSKAWVVTKFRPPALSATFFVKGTFALQPGAPAVPAPEPDPVSGDTEVYPSDFAPFKPKADLVLVGTAHAPRGKAVEACTVGFGLGKWSKQLAVASKQPFVKFSLADPAAEIVYRDRLSVKCPTAFGPIAPSAPSRMKKVGTFDKKWLKERWPWYPEDFDFGYFNAAPEDQQLPAYLRGDEELRFENLHPDHADYRTRLPGLRARCFLNEKARFREVPLVLDTLWVDMDAEKLVLVWRGNVEVQSIKLAEIEHLYTVTEKLTDRPGTLEEHRVGLEKRLREEAGEEEVVEPPPPEEKEDEEDFDEIFAKSDAEFARLQAECAQVEADAGAQIRAMGYALPPPPKGNPRELVKKAGKEAKALLEANIAEVAKYDPKAAEKLKALGSLEIPEADLPPEKEEEVEEEEPETPPWTRERVHDAVAAGEDLSGQVLKGLDLSGLSLAGARLAGADASESNLTGTDLSKAVLDGADFTKSALTKAKLAGASIRDTSFAEANLEEADFAGCAGKYTSFCGAVANKSKFSQAKLPNCDFSEAQFAQADFRGAELFAADFEKTKAAGIRFEGADLTKFRGGSGPDFTGGNFRKVKAEQSTWIGAKLDGADFVGAVLTRADFTEASLKKAVFDGAVLVKATFEDACLEGASLLRVKLAHGSFERAELRGADLRGANCYEAEFWDARLEGAKLLDCNLDGTKLSE